MGDDTTFAFQSSHRFVLFSPHGIYLDPSATDQGANVFDGFGMEGERSKAVSSVHVALRDGREEVERGGCEILSISWVGPSQQRKAIWPYMQKTFFEQ
jgi:hypothetical protein